VIKNSSTPEYKKNKKKLANKIRKAAAYRTEGSQPNIMRDKLVQIIAQNTKQKVSTHVMEPHPRMPWQLY